MRAKGLTLIELLVVLAIIAGAASLVLPAVASISGANAKKAAGELSGSMRALFDIAALRHATCRLAIDLSGRAYWAECAPGPAGVPPASDRADDEELSQRFPDESDPEIRRILAASTFGVFTDRLVPRRELPGQASFGPVHLEGRREAQETGIAYVYFFPGGQAQRASVPVEEGNNVFTVVTEPFTGRTRVLSGKQEAAE